MREREKLYNSPLFLSSTLPIIIIIKPQASTLNYPSLLVL